MTNDIEQMFGRLRRGTFFNNQDPHLIAQENYIDGGNYISPVEWTGAEPPDPDPAPPPLDIQHLTSASQINPNALQVYVDSASNITFVTTHRTILVGSPSQMLTVNNVGSYTMTFSFMGSTGLYLLGSSTYTLGAGGRVTFRYNSIVGLWFRQR